MEAYIIFIGAQKHQSNNTIVGNLLIPLFFRDALYILHLLFAPSGNNAVLDKKKITKSSENCVTL